jgi:hypothetical protein
VNELMQKQLAISPAISADDNAMANRDATRRIGDDLRVARRIRQFPVVRQRNAIDHKNPDPSRVAHASAARVRGLGGIERNAMLEDVRFLASRPGEGEGREAIKVFLVNHIREESLN